MSTSSSVGSQLSNPPVEVEGKSKAFKQPKIVPTRAHPSGSNSPVPGRTPATVAAHKAAVPVPAAVAPAETVPPVVVTGRQPRAVHVSHRAPEYVPQTEHVFTFGGAPHGHPVLATVRSDLELTIADMIVQNRSLRGMKFVVVDVGGSIGAAYRVENTIRQRYPEAVVWTLRPIKEPSDASRVQAFEQSSRTTWCTHGLEDRCRCWADIGPLACAYSVHAFYYMQSEDSVRCWRELHEASILGRSYHTVHPFIKETESGRIGEATYTVAGGHVRMRIDGTLKTYVHPMIRTDEAGFLPSAGLGNLGISCELERPVYANAQLAKRGEEPQILAALLVAVNAERAVETTVRRPPVEEIQVDCADETLSVVDTAPLDAVPEGFIPWVSSGQTEIAGHSIRLEGVKETLLVYRKGSGYCREKQGPVVLASSVNLTLLKSRLFTVFDFATYQDATARQLYVIERIKSSVTFAHSEAEGDLLLMATVAYSILNVSLTSNIIDLLVEKTAIVDTESVEVVVPREESVEEAKKRVAREPTTKSPWLLLAMGAAYFLVLAMFFVWLHAASGAETAHDGGLCPNPWAQDLSDQQETARDPRWELDAGTGICARTPSTTVFGEVYRLLDFKRQHREPERPPVGIRHPAATVSERVFVRAGLAVCEWTIVVVVLSHMCHMLVRGAHGRGWAPRAAGGFFVPNVILMVAVVLYCSVGALAQTVPQESYGSESLMLVLPLAIADALRQRIIKMRNLRRTRATCVSRRVTNRRETRSIMATPPSNLSLRWKLKKRPELIEERTKNGLFSGVGGIKVGGREFIPVIGTSSLANMAAGVADRVSKLQRGMRKDGSSPELQQAYEDLREFMTDSGFLAQLQRHDLPDPLVRAWWDKQLPNRRSAMLPSVVATFGTLDAYLNLHCSEVSTDLDEDMWKEVLKTELFVKREATIKTVGDYKPRVIQNPTQMSKILFGPHAYRVDLWMKTAFDRGGHLVYASGLNGEDVGEFVEGAAGAFPDYCVLENDMSKFEGSITKEVLDFERWFWQKLGASPFMIEFMLRDVVQNGEGGRGLFSYTLCGGRKSGRNNTSCGNSFLNIAVTVRCLYATASFRREMSRPEKFYLVMSLFRSIFMGDDNLIFISRQFFTLQGMTYSEGKGVLERAFKTWFGVHGFDAVLKVTDTVSMATFCGCHFVRTTGGIMPAPLAPRQMMKMVWATTLDGRPSSGYVQWLAQVVKQTGPAVAHVPILRTYLAKLSTLVPDVPAAAILYKPWCSRMHEITIRGVLDFCDYYGITVEDVATIEMDIAKWDPNGPLDSPLFGEICEKFAELSDVDAEPLQTEVVATW